MRNVIVGTAGHIDHGKTALVGVLTGTDTDRLSEEKRRGISIELGFAHLDVSEQLRIGFVDVPGHERFVKNMLAGVGGIDLVLFVVAADESIRPQTREHFDICRLLDIPKGIIALTKADRVDEEMLELVRLELEELIRGSFLEGAPMVPVSAKTGMGIDALKVALEMAASEVPPKDSQRHFRIPIDRVFTMRGFGTVVTGTLVSGSAGIEDEVEVHPLGERLRVRGLQVHNSQVERAFAGQRTALNLAGPATARVERGMTLTHPDLFAPTRLVDARFELLATARPLKQGSPVHFHAGTAELIAEIQLLESGTAMAPETTAFVRFRLREPVLLTPGDRFIVRKFSPVTTIGGGIVLEIAPPKMRRQATLERLRILDGCKTADRIVLIAEESRYGSTLKELETRTGYLLNEIEEAGRDDRLVWFEKPQPWTASRRLFEEDVRKLKLAVEDFHQRNPLLPGISKEQLRSEELKGAPPGYLEALLESSAELATEGEVVRLATHKLRLKEDEEAALTKIETAFRCAGLTVPTTDVVLSKAGMEKQRARDLLGLLLRQGQLVKVSEGLIFHSSAIQTLKTLLSEHRGERFKVPQFKEWTGISRKYAIPLLEHLDREHITRREGDFRTVL